MRIKNFTHGWLQQKCLNRICRCRNCGAPNDQYNHHSEEHWRNNYTGSPANCNQLLLQHAKTSRHVGLYWMLLERKLSLMHTFLARLFSRRHHISLTNTSLSNLDDQNRNQCVSFRYQLWHLRRAYALKIWHILWFQNVALDFYILIKICQRWERYMRPPLPLKMPICKKQNVL